MENQLHNQVTQTFSPFLLHNSRSYLYTRIFGTKKGLLSQTNEVRIRYPLLRSCHVVHSTN